MSETSGSDHEPRMQRLPHLDGVTARIVGEIVEVSPVYQVLKTPHTQESSLYEFYSKKLQSRLIMFDAAGNIAWRHEQLRDKGIRLFDELSISDKSLLVVPENAKNLSTLVPLLGRDIQSSTAVFERLGQALGRLDQAGYGLPEAGHVLDQFALATDQQANSELFFVPPYRMDQERSFGDIIMELDNALRDTIQPEMRSISLAAAEVGYGA